MDFYHKFYTPQSMSLVVLCDLEEEKIKEIVTRNKITKKKVDNELNYTDFYSDLERLEDKLIEIEFPSSYTED